MRRLAEPTGRSVTAGERVCSGDALRSDSSSRATFTLLDGTTLRLDENSALGPARAAVGRGLVGRAAARHHSRDQPRPAAVAVHDSIRERRPRRHRVRHSRRRNVHGSTEIVVLEGEVVVTTPRGELNVASDHVAIAQRRRSADCRCPIAEPIERMRWASYYPPLLDRAAAGAPIRSRCASQQADAGLLRGSCRGAPGNGTRRRRRSRPRHRTAARAAATRRRCRSSALLALARADRDTARALVAEALAAEPTSVVALLALSHVEQSSWHSRPPSETMREALAVEPDNAIVLTRLAELALARGDVEDGDRERRREHGAWLRPRVRRSWCSASPTCARSTLAPPQSAFAGRRRARAASAPMPRLGLALRLDPARRRARRAAAARARSRAGSRQSADAQLHGKSLRRRESRRADGEPARARQRVRSRSIRRLAVFVAAESAQQSTRRGAAGAALAPRRRTATGPSFARRFRLTRSRHAQRRHSAACTPSSVSGGSRCSTRGMRSATTRRTSRGTGCSRMRYSTRAATRDRSRQRAARRRSCLQPANVTPIKPQLAQQNLFIAQRAGPSHTLVRRARSPVVSERPEAAGLRPSRAATAPRVTT